MPLYCCNYWEASRIEVETVPVKHVCSMELNHYGNCRCECGAERDSHWASLSQIEPSPAGASDNTTAASTIITGTLQCGHGGS